MSSLNELDKSHHEKQAEHPIRKTEDILAAMRMGKRTIGEIRMGEQIIPVRVLSADEVNSIRHKAKIHVAKLGGDETDENLIIQKLTLMLSSQCGNDPIGFLHEKIVNLLSVDEIGYLYNELIAFWETFNPSLEKLSQERFRELVDALKKNKTSWNDCSIPERKAIFTCFVDMIQRQDSQTSPAAS